MKNNLKSAVAFFFLFFLHGTSIGNGQQGISYNVEHCCSCGLELPNYRLNTNLNKYKIIYQSSQIPQLLQCIVI